MFFFLILPVLEELPSRCSIETEKISLKNISSTEKKDFLMQTYKESLKAQNGSNQIVLITIDLKYYRIQRRSHHLRFRLKLINFF